MILRPSIALLSLALFAAGCGSSSPPRSGLSGRQNPVTQAYRYAACMRDHGATNFPDPHVSTSPGQTSISQVVSSRMADTPQFKAAQKACAAIMPGLGSISPAQQHAREQDLLAFARCLRAHGLRNFPDPTTQGQLTPEMLRAAGIDLQAPGVLTAARACVGVTHGAVTLADVERAVHRGQ